MRCYRGWPQTKKSRSNTPSVHAAKGIANFMLSLGLREQNNLLLPAISAGQQTSLRH